jgi:hypothetical protein
VLQAYLESIGSTTKVRGIAMSERPPKATYGLDWLSTSPYRVLESLNTDSWENVYGEFPHHAIGTVALDKAVRRPEYDRVQTIIKSHMDNDPTLATERVRLGIQ